MSDDTTTGNPDGAGTVGRQFSAEELARDSHAVTELHNAELALHSVAAEDQLTERERSRLSTIHQKVDELESIIVERKTQDIKAERGGETDE